MIRALSLAYVALEPDRMDEFRRWLLAKEGGGLTAIVVTIAAFAALGALASWRARQRAEPAERDLDGAPAPGRNGAPAPGDGDRA